jgi:hypothetical protein
MTTAHTLNEFAPLREEGERILRLLERCLSSRYEVMFSHDTK